MLASPPLRVIRNDDSARILPLTRADVYFDQYLGLRLYYNCIMIEIKACFAARHQNDHASLPCNEWVIGDEAAPRHNRHEATRRRGEPRREGGSSEHSFG